MGAFTETERCALLAELARMSALFQQRAIAAHLGFGPTAQRPPHTPHSEER